MNIALSIYNGRISPVFDTARRLMVVGMEQGVEQEHREVILPAHDVPACLTQLQSLQIAVLLCGAVSRPLADMIQAAGIEVVPFLAGDVEPVLQAYVQGTLFEPQFFMPGCCGRRRRHGPRAGAGGGGGRRCGRGGA